MLTRYDELRAAASAHLIDDSDAERELLDLAMAIADAHDRGATAAEIGRLIAELREGLA